MGLENARKVIEVISDSCPKFIPMTLLVMMTIIFILEPAAALGIRVDILINRVRRRCMGSKL